MKKVFEVEALRGFKNRSGWSYPKMAKHLKVHPQTIYNWLAGKHAASPMGIERIKKFLKVYAY